MAPALSLDAASSLVRHLGTRGFPAQLWHWLNEQLPLCHLCVGRFRQAAADQPVESCDGLFFAGIYDPGTVDSILRLYLDKYWPQDPVLPYARCVDEKQLVHIHAANLASIDYHREMFGRGELREVCVMLGRAMDGVYSVELFRNRSQPPFQLSELSLLRQLGEFVLPLVMHHARLTVPVARSRADTLLVLFDRRIAASGIRLSPRERDTCHCALQGQTSQLIALQLGVRDSTVKTYLERAFAKLSLRSRAELFSWCLV